MVNAVRNYGESQLSWKQSIVPVSSLCDMLLESTMQYNMALLELKMSVSVT